MQGVKSRSGSHAGRRSSPRIDDDPLHLERPLFQEVRFAPERVNALNAIDQAVENSLDKLFRPSLLLGIAVSINEILYRIRMR